MKSLKLKALVLAAGLVAASLSTSASATVTSVTTTAEGYSFAGKGDLVSGTNYAFDDFIALSLSNSDLVGTISGSVASKGGNFFNLTKFDIFDTVTSTAVLTGTIFNGGLVGFGLFNGTTGSGSYALHIAGNSKGSSSYAGTLSVTSAVPEPETYGMMLAGLGLMGFVARRRKSV